MIQNFTTWISLIGSEIILQPMQKALEAKTNFFCLSAFFCHFLFSRVTVWGYLMLYVGMIEVPIVCVQQYTFRSRKVRICSFHSKFREMCTLERVLTLQRRDKIYSIFVCNQIIVLDSEHACYSSMLFNK